MLTKQRASYQSARKSPQVLAVSGFLVVGPMFSGSGTASEHIMSKTENRTDVYTSLPTASRSTLFPKLPEPHLTHSLSSRQQILELHRISGLTWQQLADMFSVSRRSVHHWANGQDLSEAHAQQLDKAYCLTKRWDTGSAQANKKWLLTPQEMGSPFELLRQNKESEITQLNQPSTHQERQPVKPNKLSEHPELYLPSDPIDLMLTQHDNIEIKTGNTFRQSRSIQSLRKK